MSADASGRRPAKPTIYDVARLAGVSLKTVSRVINHEPGVRVRNRDSVQAAISSLDYQPDLSARSLAGGRSRLIGMIGDNPSPGYVGELQKGVLSACTERGHHLVLMRLDSRAPDAIRRIREALISTRLDGAILAPPDCDNAELLDELERLHVPYVRISPDLQPDRSMGVDLDNRAAAADMAEVLWRLGHRRIAFVCAPSSHVAATHRLEGFRSVMDAHGVDTPPEYLQQGDFTVASGMAAGRRLLELAQPPTAIFAGNDDMAIGVMMAAYEHGMAIPAQLSVAGFDDTPLSASVHPMLSTVRQPVAEMAAMAVRALLETRPQQRTLRIHEWVEHDIVLRGSTAAAPAADDAATPAVRRVLQAHATN